jgi:hypothetical protein
MTIAGSDILAMGAGLTEAGPNGTSEDAMVSAFCERANAIGIPAGRALAIIGTLHREASRIATMRRSVEEPVLAAGLRGSGWNARATGFGGALCAARRRTAAGIIHPGTSGVLQA